MRRPDGTARRRPGRPDRLRRQQLWMSLVADERITSSRPATMTWTPLTRRPWSAPGTGSCSLSTMRVPGRMIVVFGPGWMATRIPLPRTVREATTVSPTEPAQVVREDTWTRPTLITGMPRPPSLASWTEAVAVEVPGPTAVTTLAHSVCAVRTGPEMVSTQGGATVVAPVVATGP